MLHKNHTVYEFSLLLVLLAGCAPVQTPEPNLAFDAPVAPVIQAESASVNTVCAHRFTPAQISSAPNFIESQVNSVIAGSSQELLATLTTPSPVTSGTTVWNLKWRFDSKIISRGCQIEDVVTQVVVNYKLPLWPERLSATNRQVAEQWDQYSNAIRAHHCLHGKTGIDASIEVKESLRRMAPRRDCDQLKADADELARSIVGRYKEVESRFTTPLVTDYFFQ